MEKKLVEKIKMIKSQMWEKYMGDWREWQSRPRKGECSNIIIGKQEGARSRNDCQTRKGNSRAMIVLEKKGFSSVHGRGTNV